MYFLQDWKFSFLFYFQLLSGRLHVIKYYYQQERKSDAAKSEAATGVFCIFIFGLLMCKTILQNVHFTLS